ncbi:hypothetical protein ABT147_09185 [Streptomyces sp. NPDC001868]
MTPLSKEGAAWRPDLDDVRAVSYTHDTHDIRRVRRGRCVHGRSKSSW